MVATAAASADTGTRQKRQMDHEKERKELFFKQAAQVYYYELINLIDHVCYVIKYIHLHFVFVCFLIQNSEKKFEISEVEGQTEGQCETNYSPTNQAQASSEGGGSGAEQPFIRLSQEEYGEHHSSIMHCRWVAIKTLEIIKCMPNFSFSLNLNLPVLFL